MGIPEIPGKQSREVGDFYELMATRKQKPVSTFEPKIATACAIGSRRSVPELEHEQDDQPSQSRFQVVGRTPSNSRVDLVSKMATQETVVSIWSRRWRLKRQSCRFGLEDGVSGDSRGNLVSKIATQETVVSIWSRRSRLRR